MKSLILGLLLVSSSSLSFARGFQCNEATKTIAQQLNQLNPNIDFNLLNFEFLGGSVIGGYNYKVNPLHLKGLYARTDQWKIGVNANAERETSSDIEFGVGFTAQTEATFVRFYRNACKALAAIPYSIRRMPLTTAVATGENFATGDYFMYRSSLGFVASAEIAKLLGNAGVLELSANYLLSGSYQVHIFKIGPTEVRMKVIADRRRNISGSAGISLDDDFVGFRVNPFDDAELTPMEFTVGKEHAQIFMADYVLDLKNPAIASAYDKLLKKTKHFKNFRQLSPFRKFAKTESDLILDISELEDLYEAGVPGVQRKIHTSSEKRAKQFSFEMSLGWLGIEHEYETSTSKLTLKTDEGQRYYVLNSWDTEAESSLIFSIMRSTEERFLQVLFSANEKFQEQELSHLIFSLELQKNTINFRELQDLKTTLIKYLPTGMYAKIPWENWPQKPNQKYKNFGMWLELITNSDAILEAPALSAAQIREAFGSYMKARNLNVNHYFNPGPTPLNPHESAEWKFYDSLGEMSRLLEKVLNKSKSAATKLKEFGRLKKNSLFSQSGAGFLLSLNPQSDDDDSYLEFRMFSNDTEINLEYGDEDDFEVYEVVEKVKAALDDETYDEDVIESMIEDDLPLIYNLKKAP